MRILVADDQAFWRQALEECLVASGHRVICVGSADAAGRVLCSDPEVDLLITDWVMPGADGVELCRRVRRMERDRYLPIVMLTGSGGGRSLVEALDGGADAFLQKPFDPAELEAQLRVLARILALEGRLERRIAELRLAKERIEKDLLQAAEMQRSFMPETAPDVPGVSFAWHFQTSRHLGGDMFGVARLDDDHVGVHVLDVSGHGTSAALHSVSLSHVLHPDDRQGGVLMRRTGESSRPVPPSAVVAELNARFPLIERSGHYFTLLYGILDLRGLGFRYVRAGHPGPLHAAGGSVRSHDRLGGVPVGVARDVVWEDHEIQLARGDQLVLVSDGLFENSNAGGEAFGHARIRDVVARCADGPVRETVGALRQAHADFCKDEPPRDDVTVVGLRID